MLLLCKIIGITFTYVRVLIFVPENNNFVFFQCPAEKKIKKHVFLACLVLLLGAICVLVVAIIDGWMIEKIGKGIKENVFKGRKIDISSNATHFPDYNNDTGLGNVTGNFFNNTRD